MPSIPCGTSGNLGPIRGRAKLTSQVRVARIYGKHSKMGIMGLAISDDGAFDETVLSPMSNKGGVAEK